MNRIIRVFFHPKKALLFFLLRYSSFFSDELYLKLRFYLAFGYKLDLRNVNTYNEKLQWLKLYDRKDLYTKLVDKLAVKEYVANVIGNEYVIPTIGVWDNIEDIDWNQLPKQFVLKCTHDSGGLVICKDKSQLNIELTKKIIGKSLKCDYYKGAREWPYKNVPHKIIAEEYTWRIIKRQN